MSFELALFALPLAQIGFWFLTRLGELGRDEDLRDIHSLTNRYHELQ
jgi:hypothetical protein